MPNGKRMAALSIGVSDARPLPFLAGAVNGARAFHEWATALGYEARLLTDEEEPVTFTRLRAELDTTLADTSTPIHRLVIYFAGHGLIREAEEGLWLLSDWNKELRAVAVEPLRRRLYLYGIRQIALFADACRDLPPDVAASDLTPDAVLGRGPVRQGRPPAIDKFIAAQDGNATFMVPGPTPEEDRCLFSGVLLEGLWGKKPGAFSTLPALADKVTSRSLGAYLETEVPEIASRYQFTVFPMVSATFPEGDDIYFGEGTPIKAPAFSDWPPPDAVTRRISQGAQPAGDPESWLESAAQAPGGTGIVVPPTKPTISVEEQLKRQTVPQSFETGSGFAVDGAIVRSVWTRDHIRAEVHGQPNWWRVGPDTSQRLDEPEPVLIEFVNGLFAATTALPNFIASVICDERGVSGLVYREVYARRTIATETEKAIGLLENAGLRADAKTDLALELRHDKFADPVLGIISGYLYDSIGDVDSNRRMAALYIGHYQPIPYDIALLAQLEGERRGAQLWASVPAVEARAPRTANEARYPWAYGASVPSQGSVGGFWPLMRQGWGFLDAPSDDGSTLILPGLIELVPQLTQARFATLDAEGGRKLAELFGLRPGLGM